MDWIVSSVKTVREVYAQAPFTVAVYQRAYTWTREHAGKLIEDFADAFSESRERRRRGMMAAPYFLGPLVFHRAKGEVHVVDGQQRLTTLMLLLMRLARELGGRPPGREIEQLIRPKGTNGPFAIAVEGHVRALEALERVGAFEVSDATDPERMLVERYADFDEIMPEEAAGPSVAAFARWLLDEVVFAEIISRDESSAFQIFETMNNRGQPIRPSDLFRYYLLARIPDPEARELANENWRREAAALQAIGPGEDLVALRTVLQARYATGQQAESTITDGSLHSWSPEETVDSTLGAAADFARFLGKDLVFYGRWYRRIKQAGHAYTAGLEPLYFVARTGAPLTMRLMLAPLSPSDPEPLTAVKARIVATFLDVLAARLAWNPKARRRRALVTGLVQIVEQMRTRTPDTLALFLAAQLARLAPTFAENPEFGLGSARKGDLHAILARMSAYADFKLHGRDNYPLYEVRQGNSGFEVEPLLPAQIALPGTQREWLANLVLVPKSTVRSFLDAPVEQRLEKLAQQEGNAFNRLVGGTRDAPLTNFDSSLDTPFPILTKANASKDLAARQSALISLAERIWDPQRIIDACES